MEKIVTHFMRTGVRPEQIGIITPYEGQRAHVLSVMQRSGALASTLYAEVSSSSEACLHMTWVSPAGTRFAYSSAYLEDAKLCNPSKASPLAASA